MALEKAIEPGRAVLGCPTVDIRFPPGVVVNPGQTMTMTHHVVTYCDLSDEQNIAMIEQALRHGANVTIKQTGL